MCISRECRWWGLGSAAMVSVVMIGTWAAAPLQAAPPIRVDKTHKLLVDDRLIESMEGTQRLVNQPVKHHQNPVLTWTEPWEGNCVITWGSVLHDPHERLFRIWYKVYKKVPPPGEKPMLLCYATSRDGLKWDKPNLGLIAFQGSKANNIVMDGHMDAPTVFLNPKPRGEEKYLMYWFTRHGVRRSTSPDGVHWKHDDQAVVKAGDRCSAGYDAERKKFYVITRIPGRGLRTCGLWESDDGIRFEHVGEIAAPDDNDPPQTQFYGMITFAYAGMRIGFLEPFYIPLRKLNTQLMYSHDGHRWHRAVDRQVFLQWGPPGSWDQTWVTPSHNPPLRIGDKLYIFYQGRQTLHWCQPPFGHIGSVGLAFLRPDGFVSLEPKEPLAQKPDHGYRGTATTVPLVLQGSTLHLNAFARPGSIRVEVLDAQGKPIPGLSRDDCQPINMVDSLDCVVKWPDRPGLAKLAGKPVRLKFHLQAAKLYSFWVE